MRYQLDNGLTVILERVRSAPVVALQIWVKAGSADETPEEAGLAHLHEHMLFKGTSRRGLGAIAREIEARGGEINAWTSFDQTVYHVVVASAFFAEGLDVLADAVRHSTFDAGELSREIEVVVEEIKRSNDLPSRRLSRAMFETAFQQHPYRFPVLGTRESVRSFTREKVLAFFQKHYTPDNMVALVVGDVDEERARAEVERHLGGDWGLPRAKLPRRPAEPDQRAPRIAVAQDGVREVHLALAFPASAVEAPETAALDALAVVLGQGEGSRLNLGLKIERALASETYAYAYTPKDPGLFAAGATVSPEKAKEALAAIVRELRRLQLYPLTEDELAVAKALIEAEAIYGKETVQGVARKLGFYETTTGDCAFERTYYERVAKLTVQEVHEVALRSLTRDRLTLCALMPSGAAAGESELLQTLDAAFAEEPPPRAARVHPTPPERAPNRRPNAQRGVHSGIERALLPSGATILVKPERSVPLFSVRAIFPGGLRYETEANNGISQLYARLTTRATRNHSSVQLARAIDDLSGSLHGSAGRNSIGLRGEFLSKHFERGLRLLAECLAEPSFGSEELERERALLLQDLHARDDNPGGAAFDLFARTLFTSHPYRLDVLGEVGSVSALGEPDLRALQRAALHPANLTVSIVGDVDVERAFGLCEELFGAAPGPAPEGPQIPVEPEQREPRRSFKLNEKEQAHLVLGFKGVTVRSPERHALEVLSSVLSGQGGRLFMELRDKRSLAYSVSSFSVEGLDPGYFGVYMGTSAEKVGGALAGIRAELARAAESPLAPEELERAQRYLVGAHAIGLQKNSARAAIIAYDSAYGLGADNHTRYEEQIHSVTAAQVQEVARRLLQPRRAALAILGPKAADVPYEVS